VLRPTEGSREAVGRSLEGVRTDGVPRVPDGDLPAEPTEGVPTLPPAIRSEGLLAVGWATRPAEEVRVWLAPGRMTPWEGAVFLVAG
jgi:hypothetical protein